MSRLLLMLVGPVALVHAAIGSPVWHVSVTVSAWRRSLGRHLPVPTHSPEALFGFEHPGCAPTTPHLAITAPFHIGGGGAGDRDHGFNRVGRLQRLEWGAGDSKTGTVNMSSKHLACRGPGCGTPRSRHANAGRYATRSISTGPPPGPTPRPTTLRYPDRRGHAPTQISPAPPTVR